MASFTTSSSAAAVQQQGQGQHDAPEKKSTDEPLEDQRVVGSWQQEKGVLDLRGRGLRELAIVSHHIHIHNFHHTLQVLNLAHNRIRRFDLLSLLLGRELDGTGHQSTPSLTELYLNDNRLEDLSCGINQEKITSRVHTKLRILHLQNNHLSRLPRSLVKGLFFPASPSGGGGVSSTSSTLEEFGLEWWHYREMSMKNVREDSGAGSVKKRSYVLRKRDQHEAWATLQRISDNISGRERETSSSTSSKCEIRGGAEIDGTSIDVVVPEIPAIRRRDRENSTFLTRSLRRMAGTFRRGTTTSAKKQKATTSGANDEETSDLQKDVLGLGSEAASSCTSIGYGYEFHPGNVERDSRTRTATLARSTATAKERDENEEPQIRFWDVFVSPVELQGPTTHVFVSPVEKHNYLLIEAARNGHVGVVRGLLEGLEKRTSSNVLPDKVKNKRALEKNKHQHETKTVDVDTPLRIALSSLPLYPDAREIVRALVTYAAATCGGSKEQHREPAVRLQLANYLLLAVESLDVDIVWLLLKRDLLLVDEAYYRSWTSSGGTATADKSDHAMEQEQEAQGPLQRPAPLTCLSLLRGTSASRSTPTNKPASTSSASSTAPSSSAASSAWHSLLQVFSRGNAMMWSGLNKGWLIGVLLCEYERAFQMTVAGINQAAPPDFYAPLHYAVRKKELPALRFACATRDTVGAVVLQAVEYCDRVLGAAAVASSCTEQATVQLDVEQARAPGWHDDCEDQDRLSSQLSPSKRGGRLQLKQATKIAESHAEPPTASKDLIHPDFVEEVALVKAVIEGSRMIERLSTTSTTSDSCQEEQRSTYLPIDLNLRGGKGRQWTALHLAAKLGHVSVMKLLLEGGADPLEECEFADPPIRSKDLVAPEFAPSKNRLRMTCRQLSRRHFASGKLVTLAEDAALYEKAMLGTRGSRQVDDDDHHRLSGRLQVGDLVLRRLRSEAFEVEADKKKAVPAPPAMSGGGTSTRPGPGRGLGALNYWLSRKAAGATASSRGGTDSEVQVLATCDETAAKAANKASRSGSRAWARSWSTTNTRPNKGATTSTTRDLKQAQELCASLAALVSSGHPHQVGSRRSSTSQQQEPKNASEGPQSAVLTYLKALLHPLMAAMSPSGTLVAERTPPAPARVANAMDFDFLTSLFAAITAATASNKQDEQTCATSRTELCGFFSLVLHYLFPDDPATRAIPIETLVSADSVAAAGVSASSRLLNRPLVAETRQTLLHRVCAMKDGQSTNSVLQAEDVDNLVPLLLACGADPALQERTTGWTSLHLAVNAGNVSVVRQLLDRGDGGEKTASLVNTGDRFGWLPIYEAASRADRDCVRLLLERGAQANFDAMEDSDDVIGLAPEALALLKDEVQAFAHAT